MKIDEVISAQVASELGDNLFLLEMDGSIIDVNAAAISLYGYSRDEFIHLNIRDIRTPEPDGFIQVQMDGALKHGIAFEAQHRRADGSVFPVDIRSTGVTRGDATAVLSSVRDISERRAVEQALAAHAARNEALMSASSEGIHVLDSGGHVVEVNQAFCELLSYSAEEALQLSVWDWDLQWKKHELPGIVQGLIANPRSFETEVITKDGRIRTLEIHSVPVILDDNVCLYNSARDITVAHLSVLARTDHLESLANTDLLTGLHNVRGLKVAADQAVAQAVRQGDGVGVIFCDVDGLKSVNDVLGHVQGDRVLRDTAWVLRSTLRDADVLGRVGGDEFVVLSTGGDADGLAEQLARIQAALASFNDSHTRPYRLEVSTGMAWADGADEHRFDYLMATADTAMYDHKQSRRAAR